MSTQAAEVGNMEEVRRLAKILLEPRGKTHHSAANNGKKPDCWLEWFYDCCDANGAVLSTACWEPATMSVGAIFRMMYTFAWLLGTLGVRKTALFGAVLFKLEAKRHRHAPTAHHLQLLGTSPDHQSKGLGATAMMIGIRRAEQQGVPCYLESSNPKNVPFYKRHGFKIVEEYYHWEAEGAVDGDGQPVKGRGPVATLMLRPLGTR